jgi:hypothetical protein
MYNLYSGISENYKFFYIFLYYFKYFILFYFIFIIVDTPIFENNLNI